MIMHSLRGFVLALLSGLFLSAAVWAAEGSVSITAPQEGARLDAMAENRISYAVEPGPRGDHVHLYVDGKEVAVLRRLQGSYALPTMESGNREVCIKVVNKGHTPIGVEQCVKVMVD
ncbi:MAG: hypothetical protein Kow0096_25840 [Thiohalomonadaceae bacterium]